MYSCIQWLCILDYLYGGILCVGIQFLKYSPIVQCVLIIIIIFFCLLSVQIGKYTHSVVVLSDDKIKSPFYHLSHHFYHLFNNEKVFFCLFFFFYIENVHSSIGLQSLYYRLQSIRLVLNMMQNLVREYGLQASNLGRKLDEIYLDLSPVDQRPSNKL